MAYLFFGMAIWAGIIAVVASCYRSFGVSLINLALMSLSLSMMLITVTP